MKWIIKHRLIIILFLLLGLNIKGYYFGSLKALRTESEIIKEKLQHESKLVKKIQEIDRLIDSLEIPGINSNYIEQLIIYKTTKLSTQNITSTYISNDINHLSILHREIAINKVEKLQTYNEIEELKKQSKVLDDQIDNEYKSIVLQLARKHRNN